MQSLEHSATALSRHVPRSSRTSSLSPRETNPHTCPSVHLADEPESSYGSACFSSSKKYRFRLIRTWLDLFNSSKVISFCLLNPSVANAIRLDNTLRRCYGFTQRFGGCEMRIFNAFPIVGTKPTILKTPAAERMLDVNDAHIHAAIADSDLFILGFGAMISDFPQRYESLREIFRGVDVYALDTTEVAGLPKHPLYLKGNLTPVRFTWPSLASDR